MVNRNQDVSLSYCQPASYPRYIEASGFNRPGEKELLFWTLDLIQGCRISKRAVGAGHIKRALGEILKV